MQQTMKTTDFTETVASPNQKKFKGVRRSRFASIITPAAIHRIRYCVEEKTKGRRQTNL
jgi:hypothetical protein